MPDLYNEQQPPRVNTQLNSTAIDVLFNYDIDVVDRIIYLSESTTYTRFVKQVRYMLSTGNQLITVYVTALDIPSEYLDNILLYINSAITYGDAEFKLACRQTTVPKHIKAFIDDFPGDKDIPEKITIKKINTKQIL